MFDFRDVFSCGARIAPTKKQMSITAKLKGFSDDEDGVATVWAMFWLIICFALSGLAIDVTNAWKVQQFLQSTADSSALAGAIELQTVNNLEIEEAVEIEANKFATYNMSEEVYGDVLIDPDILVGYWNRSSRVFTLMTDTSGPPANAVQTITRQNDTQNHGVGTFFLRFAGFTEFTIATAATATAFTSNCHYDGIIAGGQVKLSAQNGFYNEYCVHGEQGINASQDNYFEAPALDDDGEYELDEYGNVIDSGTIASMKDFDDCGPSYILCWSDANPNLSEVLLERSIAVSKVARIDDYLLSMFLNLDTDSGANLYIESLLYNGAYAYSEETSSDTDTPFFFTLQPIVPIEIGPKNPFDLSMLKPGVVNQLNCPRDGYVVNLGGAEEQQILQNIVLLGDLCAFKFDNTVRFIDTVIATNSTSNKSMNGSSEVYFGLDDDCTQGGEVTLVTKGSVDFAAKMNSFDLEIIAEDDVHLASKMGEESIHEGTSITAGGDVQITTGHQFYGCAGKTTSVFDRILTFALVK